MRRPPLPTRSVEQGPPPGPVEPLHGPTDHEADAADAQGVGQADWACTWSRMVMAGKRAPRAAVARARWGRCCRNSSPARCCKQ